MQRTIKQIFRSFSQLWFVRVVADYAWKALYANYAQQSLHGHEHSEPCFSDDPDGVHPNIREGGRLDDFASSFASDGNAGDDN